MTDAQLNNLYADLDALLWACDRNGKDFSPFDDRLRAIDVATADPDLLLAYLTHATLAKTRLPYRPEFVRRCAERFKRTDPAEWKGLMYGLT